MKWFNNLSLGGKIIVVNILSSLVLVIIAVVIGVFEFSSSFKESAVKDVELALNSYVEQLNEYKNTSLYFSSQLSENAVLTASIKNNDRLSLETAVKRIISGTDLDYVIVADKSGNVILSVGYLFSQDGKVIDRTEISSALHNSRSTILESWQNDKISISTGSPVIDGNGNVIAAVSAGYLLSDNAKLDRLKSQYKTDFTLFLGDTRISTTIINGEGKRLVGTKLDPKIAQIVLSKNSYYSGSADILGIPYVTAYRPIHAPDGKAMGVIFAGNPLSQISATRNSIILKLLPVIIIVFLSIGFIVIRVMKKILIKPIMNLIENGADKIAAGDIEIDFNSSRTDEIGRLERAFMDMVSNIKMKVSAAEKISSGQLEFDLELKSEKDILGKSILKISSTLKELVAETKFMTDSYIHGRLSVRAITDKYSGSYRELLSGFNSGIDEIVFPTREGSMVLEKLASGDLTARVTGEFDGDHKILINSINTLAESMETAISEVSRTVGITVQASSQISESAVQIADGTKIQSDQSTEIASAIEEMTRTIFENSKNSSFASEAARQAGQKAVEGGGTVGESISGMLKIAEIVDETAVTVEALGQSSREIGDIIQVIDDIADQTNLLALNAAIEAARAGEQGRGFAVVADEVRKLADKTSLATKEITTMIRTIQEETNSAVESIKEGTAVVSKGKELAQKADVSLREIIQETDKVAELVSQVAVASEEQSATVEQISRSVEGISGVIQKSVDGTTMTAHAAEELNELTGNLQDLVSKFRLSDQVLSDRRRTAGIYS
ncbi:MAG: methyl-accepting chemotaxis protein [Bacteroidota bacterium]